jgi:demethylmenaquinone methyltransferase/2-methoxy-6-polyprenyl-1,4-benzoquinol methylase
MNDYQKKLQLSDHLRGTLVRSIIQSLKLPLSSRGIDIGCGIGSNTILLATAIGQAGRVMGIDISEEMLAHARQRAIGNHLSRQWDFQKASMYNLPFDDNSVDWVWSMDCAGYAPGDKQSVFMEMARVVKPGGEVFIAGWTSQQLLPGYPFLEAKLNTTADGIAPFSKNDPPDSHFLRTLERFKSAGFKECNARTFTGDIQAPLSPNRREALVSLVAMRWGDPKTELTADEWAEYLRICDPDSPECIIDLPDYYGFFSYTLFRAKI